MADNLKDVNAIDDRRRLQAAGIAVASAGGVALTMASASPSLAAGSTPLDDVTALMTTLGTLTGAAAATMLIALGIRLGVKQVNRVLSKA